MTDNGHGVQAAGSHQPGDLLHRGVRVHEIVSHPDTSVHADTTVQEVAGLMRDSGLDAVPVVGHDGRLIGVVTRTDLVRLLAGGP